MMTTEMVLETSVQYRHLTRLIARENFIEQKFCLRILFFKYVSCLNFRFIKTFEYGVLRKIFEHHKKPNKVSEQVRMLLNKEVRYIYRPPSFVMIMKPSRVHWTGNVIVMGKQGRHVQVWLGNLHLEDRE
jgi:hypothetical protein